MQVRGCAERTTSVNMRQVFPCVARVAKGIGKRTRALENVYCAHIQIGVRSVGNCFHVQIVSPLLRPTPICTPAPINARLSQLCPRASVRGEHEDAATSA